MIRPISRFFFLLSFINLCEFLESKKIPPRIGDANMEKEMKKSLLDIHNSELEPLVKNLTVIMDKLIELLITAYKIGGQLLSLGPTVFESMCLVSQKLSVRIRINNMTSRRQRKIFNFLNRKFVVSTGRPEFRSEWSPIVTVYVHPIPK